MALLGIAALLVCGRESQAFDGVPMVYAPNQVLTRTQSEMYFALSRVGKRIRALPLSQKSR